MNDDILEELRAIRHQISEEFDQNIQHYIDYLHRQREQYAHQLELGHQIVERAPSSTTRRPEDYRKAA